jgi:hypothetical protein
VSAQQDFVCLNWDRILALFARKLSLRAAEGCAHYPHGTMLYKTLSAAVYGIDANIIQVEVDCSGIKCDQDHCHTVGLPDAAVRESRDRVRAALKNLPEIDRRIHTRGRT